MNVIFRVEARAQQHASEATVDMHVCVRVCLCVRARGLKRLHGADGMQCRSGVWADTW